MRTPATLQLIATRLGLSKTTVSVALRGKPGVSDAMRARIIAEAAKLGYRPNPVAAELMSMVRSRRKRQTAETIAFINTFREDPTLLFRIRTFHDFFTGAQEQAAFYGYKLEEFRVGGSRMSSDRLDGVLKARGLRGVIVGPRWFDEPEITIDWNAYSCVLVGETTYGASIYRVCNHHAHTTELALTKLAALGYRRIGLQLVANYESVRHFDFLAGVEPAQRAVGDATRFIVQVQPRVSSPRNLLVPPEERQAQYLDYTNRHVIPKIAEWVQKERLDALVTLAGYDIKTIRSIRTHRNQPLGFARLDVHPDEPCTGVVQHGRDIGRTAMDLLRSLLHAGERGVAPRPRVLLVEGEWFPGETAPPV